MIPVSIGTRVVSHCHGENARYGFMWIEDGDVRVTPELLDAATFLCGTAPIRR